MPSTISSPTASSGPTAANTSGAATSEKPKPVADCSAAPGRDRRGGDQRHQSTRSSRCAPSQAVCARHHAGHQVIAARLAVHRAGEVEVALDRPRSPRGGRADRIRSRRRRPSRSAPSPPSATAEFTCTTPWMRTSARAPIVAPGNSAAPVAMNASAPMRAPFDVRVRADQHVVADHHRVGRPAAHERVLHHHAALADLARCRPRPSRRRSTARARRRRRGRRRTGRPSGATYALS